MRPLLGGGGDFPGVAPRRTGGIRRLRSRATAGQGGLFISSAAAPCALYPEPPSGLCSATPPSALPCRTQHTRPQISVGWGPAPGGALESPWGKRRRQRPRSPRPLPPSPSYGPAGPRRPLRRRPGTTLRPQPPCRALCSPAPASGPAERSGGARTLPRAATAAAPPAPRAAAAVTSVRPVTPLPGSARETAPPHPSRRAPRLAPAAPTFPSSPRGRTPPAGAALRRGARRELYAARGRQRRGGAAGGVRGVLRALRAAAARALPADGRSARGAGTGASRPSSPHSAASAARPGAAMSGLLGKLFGTGAGGKGAGKGPSPQDAIQKLRETEDLLSKKQDFLEKKIEEELAAARKHGTKNKRGEWPGRAPGNRSGGGGPACGALAVPCAQLRHRSAAAFYSLLHLFSSISLLGAVAAPPQGPRPFPVRTGPASPPGRTRRSGAGARLPRHAA